MLKVLLIEDNPGDARLIREELSDTDQTRCEVVWVDQLESGIERIVRDAFDVVLLDLSLPDSHGMETIIDFRAQAPSVPIVVLTGLDDEEAAINAVQHGAQDYLIKGQVNSAVIIRSMRYAIERHRLQGELYNLSIIDELTSLYNRRGFFKQAQLYMNAKAQEGKGFYLIVADLDGMKQINDSYGHHMGDAALVDTAYLLREVFADSEIIARMGGDEFTVILPDTMGHFREREQIEQEIIARVQQRLQRFNAEGGRLYKLSISLGLFRYSSAVPATLGELIIQADQRMYAHKKEKVR